MDVRSVQEAVVEVVADHPHSCQEVVVHLMQVEPVEEGVVMVVVVVVVVVVGQVHSFLKWEKDVEVVA